MKFCNMCGKEIADNAAFCSDCGAPVTPVQTPTTEVPTQPAPQPMPEQQAQQYPVQQQYPEQQVQQQYPMQQAQQIYQYPMQPAPVSKAAKILGTISFVLGLLSIIFCWFSLIPIFGIFVATYCITSSIIGIVLAAISKKKGNVKKATTGKVLSIISLIVAIIGCFFSGVFIGLLEADSYSDYDDDYYYSDYDYDYDYDDDWLDYTNS